VGDVISGQVQATFTSGVSLLPQVHVGTLRALGVSTREQLSIAREIPAVAETLPGFDLSAWYRIVDRLNGWPSGTELHQRLGGAAGACRRSALLGRQAQRQIPSSPASRRSFRQR
jgi:hypothetical protein